MGGFTIFHSVVLQLPCLYHSVMLYSYIDFIVLPLLMSLFLLLLQLKLKDRHTNQEFRFEVKDPIQKSEEDPDCKELVLEFAAIRPDLSPLQGGWPTVGFIEMYSLTSSKDHLYIKTTCL